MTADNADLLRDGLVGDWYADRFYERHGFIRAPEQTLRLYRRMKDVRASVQAPVRSPGSGATSRPMR
jgi:hypothetical protein